ncbi:hypothetical protein GCM10009808_11070 [Microbacterium sediminicola]
MRHRSQALRVAQPLRRATSDDSDDVNLIHVGLLMSAGVRGFHTRRADGYRQMITVLNSEVTMKVRASIKSLKNQPGAQVVRRRGRVYVINKLNPRFKGRQG